MWITYIANIESSIGTFKSVLNSPINTIRLVTPYLVQHSNSNNAYCLVPTKTHCFELLLVKSTP